MVKQSHFGDLFECHGTTRVGERGQVVIPKKLRSEMKINKGDTFLVIEKDGAIVLARTDMMRGFISHVTKELDKN